MSSPKRSFDDAIATVSKSYPVQAASNPASDGEASKTASIHDGEDAKSRVSARLLLLRFPSAKRVSVLSRVSSAVATSR